MIFETPARASSLGIASPIAAPSVQRQADATPADERVERRRKILSLGSVPRYELTLIPVRPGADPACEELRARAVGLDRTAANADRAGVLRRLGD